MFRHTVCNQLPRSTSNRFFCCLVAIFGYECLRGDDGMSVVELIRMLSIETKDDKMPHILKFGQGEALANLARS